MKVLATPLSLLDALRVGADVKFSVEPPIDDIDAFVASVRPHFGELRWTPPPSYRTVLAAGPVAAHRLEPATEKWSGFSLLGVGEIGPVNEDLVHMPEGVSRDADIYLTTNHLVGFAEAGDEAVWCFDVTAGEGGEYPVYYHHQDEPRARIQATGAWEEPASAEPDFVSFTQWLETFTAAMTAAELPRWFGHLGQPGLSFVKYRMM